jgi:hypothetical protein
MRKPEFQKSGRIEATNLSGEHFGRSEFSGDPGSVSVSCRRMSPVNMVFFVPITTGSTEAMTMNFLDQWSSKPRVSSRGHLADRTKSAPAKGVRNKASRVRRYRFGSSRRFGQDEHGRGRLGTRAVG